eukprot:TRINITY_DN49275_c0_g1_i1.p1 TRINITY_DN49275_c0_g1~~TRINITY_DN49275_c0_g1_i1.p1  ORF type:complete len:415 (+),score=37.09 TRINITY_DN49275_c0_g1_i1:48-1292(+)
MHVLVTPTREPPMPTAKQRSAYRGAYSMDGVGSGDLASGESLQAEGQSQQPLPETQLPQISLLGRPLPGLLPLEPRLLAPWPWQPFPSHQYKAPVSVMNAPPLQLHLPVPPSRNSFGCSSPVMNSWASQQAPAPVVQMLPHEQRAAFGLRPAHVASRTASAPHRGIASRSASPSCQRIPSRSTSPFNQYMATRSTSPTPHRMASRSTSPMLQHVASRSSSPSRQDWEAHMQRSSMKVFSQADRAAEAVKMDIPTKLAPTLGAACLQKQQDSRNQSVFPQDFVVGAALNSQASLDSSAAERKSKHPEIQRMWTRQRHRASLIVGTTVDSPRRLSADRNFPLFKGILSKQPRSFSPLPLSSPYQAMDVNDLKLEIKRRGLDFLFCFTREDLMSRLTAADEAAVAGTQMYNENQPER